MKTDMAVIGGGPAGIAVSIQLKRYGFDPLLFEAGQLGGLLRNANLVENYPGFPGGIGGAELVGRLISQLNLFEINLKNENVLSLDYNYEKKRFIIKTDRSDYNVSIAVIASGTIPVKPEFIEILPDSIKSPVYYEVFPLLNLSDKAIIIIGGGDAAFDYALSLSRKNKVTILNRSDKISALPLLQKRVDSIKNIDYFDRSIPVRIEEIEDNKMLVEYKRSDKRHKIVADYIVAAIGRRPQTNFYSENIINNKAKLINSGCLYEIGDVKNGRYRQLSIAVGDGVKAAMQIFHNTEGRG